MVGPVGAALEHAREAGGPAAALRSTCGHHHLPAPCPRADVRESSARVFPGSGGRPAGSLVSVTLSPFAPWRMRHGGVGVRFRQFRSSGRGDPGANAEPLVRDREFRVPGPYNPGSPLPVRDTIVPLRPLESPRRSQQPAARRL